MKAPVNSRYAHCDGITGIAPYEDGKDGKILTCGSDGDIRMWTKPEDESPVVFSASDGCLAICCHKNVAYVGTENNTVESFSLPSGKLEKVITKFTAAVNHVDVSKSGDILVAASGDMTFQIIKLRGDSPPTKVEGHRAPVLSVCVSPNDEFVISTGCDGCVCIWDLTGKQVKSWDGVFQHSNDISTSKTLCRPSWSSNGKFLAVPQKNTIDLFSVGDWKELKTLQTVGSNTKMLSVAIFSQCNKYLAAGSTNGTLYVWNVESGSLFYENVDTKDHISGLMFSRSGKDILAVDLKGRMIYVYDFLKAFDSQDQDLDDELGADVDNTIEDGAVVEDDPFDDDMNDLLIDEEDPEGNEFSISKIKAMAGFIASDKNDDVFVGIDKAKKMAGLKSNVDDDAISVSSRDENSRPHADVKPVQRPIPMELPFTEPQIPFQPTSSPDHLKHRFMAWNSIGIVRNYELEDDESDAIDIEFHDVSFHNGIHLRNQHNYSIAAIGKEAIIFASAKHSDSLSKIMCLHFSSWENNKEWTTELPKHEEATALAIGSGWFAVGTNLNRVRIFSTGGVQRNLVDFGGQIIAVSGHEDLLFVTYHTGIGLYGNQCISYSIIRIRVSTGLFPLISNEPLPLGPKSEVSWIGFSDEGTPAFSDSKGAVRILSGRLWTTFLNMKEGQSRNDSDFYWVTGLSVCSQHIRAIKCKGTRYPPTLPRPTILLLDAKLPLCEMDTEKSQLEDNLLRSILQNSVTKKMDKKGFDMEEYKEKAEKDIKENLMKLFAICCKADKDFRSSEYVTMMPSTHSIQVAIKYANKLRKMALTDRLTAIGRKRLDEEEEGLEEEDDDFENMRTGNIIYSSVYSALGSKITGNGSTFMDSSSNSFNANKSSSEVVFFEENPLLTRQRAEIQALSLSSIYKNPFKKDGNVSSKTTTSNATNEGSSSKGDSESGKGLSLIDAWKKPVDKPSVEFNTKHLKGKPTKKSLEKADKKTDKKSSEKADKNSSKVPKKTQPTLFSMGKNPILVMDKDPKSLEEDSNNDENSVLSVDCESDDDIEPSLKSTEKKRKRSGDNDEKEKEKKSRKSSLGSRLSVFALNRNDASENDELSDV